MKKIIAIITLFFALSAFGADGKSLAKKLGISASSKASAQWNRVFKKAKKMKKYGIDALSDADKGALKSYLVSHAADSDSPEAAGM
jgi:ABC-type metal ion transport system substrate-binding protein